MTSGEKLDKCYLAKNLLNTNNNYPACQGFLGEIIINLARVFYFI